MGHFISCVLLLMVISPIHLLAQNVSKIGRQWENVFKNPPLSASPGCYYYWDTGNISEYGITKDLEMMKAVGIDEPFIADIRGKRAEQGPVKAFSEKWWKCMVHATNEAKRLGMHVGYFNCPGWSQSGGPWVKPTETMRYLISRECKANIKGRSDETVYIKLGDLGFPKLFQLVKVQAFPTPKYDGDQISDKCPTVTAINLDRPELLFDSNMNTITKSNNKTSVITLSLPKADTFRSLQIYPSNRVMEGYCLVEYLGNDGHWRCLDTVRITRAKLDTAVGPMVEGPITTSFSAVTARQFRFSFTTNLGIKLREINLSRAPLMAFSTEKQLGKLWPYPEVTADCYDWPATVQPSTDVETIVPEEVIDLTSHVIGDSILSWQAPKGRWTILVTGMTPTGVFNSPCIPEASGWEIDKMNRQIAGRHFDTYIGELLRRIPKENRDAVRHLVVDSYEKGSQNWTDGFAEDFKHVYGYSPYPYLPVFTGRIVGSAECSERFLWDVRRLIADRIATEYIAGLKAKANENGLHLWMENYGHWGYPGEFLNYGGASDEVSGEFWISVPQRGTVEVRCAASAAHIYGKPRVSCEAFTDSRTNFCTLPKDLKLRGDWAFAQGVNHYVMHVYLHQPDDRKPGFCAWFGTDFNRNNTWFAKAKSYFDYVKRTSALLQQGISVSDVVYFIGENTPKMTGEMRPSLPKGYDYDFINAEVLMMAKVNSAGRIELPSGTSYAVLVLPADKTMRPEMAKKLVELLKAGAKIMGTAPQKSPSMKDYPTCDDEVMSYAKEMNASGLIAPSAGLTNILSRFEVMEDCLLPDGMLYAHRQQGDNHLYFISNQEKIQRTEDISFRVSGMLPELWDAVTGKIIKAKNYRMENGRTIVRLHLAATASIFVVFREKTDITSVDGWSVPRYDRITTLNGKWNVRFCPSYDKPFEMEFEKLTDWSQNAADNVCYFAGSATYTKTFEYKGKVDKPVYLDLGHVEGIAIVRINGIEMPMLWLSPYRTDISKILKKGRNIVEIEITNCWWNRLVGDCQPGVKAVTWTTNKTFNAKSKLMPSGLIGPVQIMSEVIPE